MFNLYVYNYIHKNNSKILFVSVSQNRRLPTEINGIIKNNGLIYLENTSDHGIILLNHWIVLKNYMWFLVILYNLSVCFFKSLEHTSLIGMSPSNDSSQSSGNPAEEEETV